MFGQCQGVVAIKLQSSHVDILLPLIQFCCCLIIVVVCTYSQQDNAVLVLLMKFCSVCASINHNVPDNSACSRQGCN